MSLSNIWPKFSMKSSPRWVAPVSDADMRVRQIDKDEWTVLAKGFCVRTYQQGPSYAEIAALRVGARSELIAIFSKGTLLGLAAARIKKWPLLPFRIAYVHAGPIYTKDQIGAFRDCARALTDYYVSGAGTLLRIVPASIAKEEAGEQAAALLALGFVRSQARAYRTLIKKIDVSDAVILCSFDKKWRSDLARSQRAGLVITHGTDPENMRRFESLHNGLRIRKHFHVSQDGHFFAKVQSNASPLERIVVHIAWSDGNPVAGHVGSISGDTAVYLLGAANGTGRDLRASFLLQWEFIRYARERGALWYDLGGIDPEKNPDVYRFKKRLSGEDVTWAGSFDYGALRPISRVMAIFGK